MSHGLNIGECDNHYPLQTQPKKHADAPQCAPDIAKQTTDRLWRRAFVALLCQDG